MRGRHPGAFIAILALTLLSVSVGTSASAQDSAGPGQAAAPAILTPAAGHVTNDPTPTFAGTASGTSVTVITHAMDHPLCVAPIVGSAWSCTSRTLPDGSYTLRAVVRPPGFFNDSVEQTITIDTARPDVPRITAPAGHDNNHGILEFTTNDNRPAISGTGEASATVTLYDGRTAVACDTKPLIVNASGAWACRLLVPLSAGVHDFSTTQTDRAGNTSDGGPECPQLRLTVSAVAPPPPPPVVVPPVVTPVTPPVVIAPVITPPVAASPASATTPRAVAPAPTRQLPTLHLPVEPEPLAWELTVVPDGAVAPGESVTLRSSGLPAGAAVTVELQSSPVVLGTTTVAADGSFVITAMIPRNVQPGEHHYVVTVIPIDGAPAALDHAVTVIPALASVPASTGHGTSVPPQADPKKVEANRNDLSAPSSLTTALPTLQHLFSNPAVLATAAGSGAALLVFVALPAELLNSTLYEQYERIFGRMRKVRVHWFDRLRRRLARKPLVSAIAITAAAALLFGFADPHFGPDISSLRLVLACAIALFIVGYLANTLTGRFVRERWQVASSLEVKPLALILTVIGVLLSRLLEFSPGFLIGLIVGFSLTGATTLHQRSRTVLLHAGIILTFGLAAWIGYSALIAETGGHPTSFLGALGLETMAAVTAEGLTMLLIGLLPFRFLEGENVFKESRLLWAGSYLVVLLMFCLIVLPDAANWEELHGSLWLWLSVVVGFSVLSVSIYLYFRYFAPSSARKELARERALVQK